MKWKNKIKKRIDQLKKEVNNLEKLNLTYKIKELEENQNNYLALNSLEGKCVTSHSGSSELTSELDHYETVFWYLQVVMMIFLPMYAQTYIG